MKRALLILVATSCSSTEICLEEGEPTRVNGCTLVATHVYADLLDIESSCEAPESSLHDDKWWGDGAPPPGYSVALGDCLLLRDKFFCVADMDPPQLCATYEMPTHGGVLRRVKPAD